MSKTTSEAVKRASGRRSAIVRAADEYLFESVRQARLRSESWTAIGSALGCSRQSAWERFSSKLEERTDDQLVTVECSLPGQAYKLLEAGPNLVVHLANQSRRGGTKPCICGFDRFAAGVGFSIGGGVSGSAYTHMACQACAGIAGARPVTGLHADLFAKVVAA